jgi:hypothetical protein
MIRAFSTLKIIIEEFITTVVMHRQAGREETIN